MKKLTIGSKIIDAKETKFTVLSRKGLEHTIKNDTTEETSVINQNKLKKFYKEA